MNSFGDQKVSVFARIAERLSWAVVQKTGRFSAQFADLFD